jgi:GntR family transcriptional regulator, transcriptional repressor for pyruvate dehydrogenase complex
MAGKSSINSGAARTTEQFRGRAHAATAELSGTARSPAFTRIHMRRTFEEICDRIREQLALGALKPGDKLPAERDLALQLGVSRNVLREAIRSLEMAGVLRLQKGVKGGAFVCEGDTSRMNGVMRDMLSLGTISIRELSDARIEILDLVVRLACRNARDVDLETLQRNVDLTRAATREGRLLERVEYSREFYRLVAAATGNKVIAMIVHSVTDIHMRFVYAKVASSGVTLPRLIERRQAFLDALRTGDEAKATRLMRSHLVSVHRMLEADPGAMSLHVALAEIRPTGAM